MKRAEANLFIGLTSRIWHCSRIEGLVCLVSSLESCPVLSHLIPFHQSIVSFISNTNTVPSLDFSLFLRLGVSRSASHPIPRSITKRRSEVPICLSMFCLSPYHDLLTPLPSPHSTFCHSSLIQSTSL